MKKTPKSKPSTVDKQSVRTTFKLTQETIDYLKLRTQEDSITIKELLDSWCSDLFDFFKAGLDSEETIKRLEKVKDLPRFRKTYVINRRTFKLLNSISKEYNISRDMLIEQLVFVIQKLIEWFNKRAEKSKKNYPKVIPIIEELSQKMSEVQKRLDKLILVDDDPIYQRLNLIHMAVDNLISAIDEETQGGPEVDPDDIYQY